MFVHELGHFIVARSLGIRVLRFYLFFDANGFALIRCRIGHTEYGIGWLPLGSYLQIPGISGVELPEGTSPPLYDLRSRPRAVRAMVILAGVVANILCSTLLVRTGTDPLHPFVLLNCLLALLNLLPRAGTDGALLFTIYPMAKTPRVVMSFVIWCAALCLMAALFGVLPEWLLSLLL